MLWEGKVLQAGTSLRFLAIPMKYYESCEVFIFNFWYKCCLSNGCKGGTKTLTEILTGVTCSELSKAQEENKMHNSKALIRFNFVI